jgi:hypothetical protein
LAGPLRGWPASAPESAHTRPELPGVQADDGFAVGHFTTSTIFLLPVVAGLGGAVGAAYLVVRGVLRRRGGRVTWIAAVGLYSAADLLAPGEFRRRRARRSRTSQATLPSSGS